MGRQVQPLGLYLAGFVCLVLAVLKLTIEVEWSWWRVLIPLWVVLGHNALYVTVGFVWLSFTDHGTAREEVTIRQGHHPYGYQLAAMLCWVVFTDNVLGRIEGEKAAWFWLSSGGWVLMFVAALLSVLCQLVFWSRVVVRDHRGTHGE